MKHLKRFVNAQAATGWFNYASRIQAINNR